MPPDLGDGAIPDEVARRFRTTSVRNVGVTSVLYDGRDETSGRAVVVKVVRNSTLPSIAARLFLHDELEKLREIEHPGLPVIVAAGEADDGKLWLAREAIDGQ